ncbi:hypothetical protein JHK85_004666 [Glycine max]|nr:hypothetical protein JHK85_004666 [Glycine max]KAG5080423.1 hypothetical protein JHK86_004488 [Glycine max]
MHNQLGMCSSGSQGLHMLQSEATNVGGNATIGTGGGFPDFVCIGSGKQDIGISGEGRGGNSSGHSGDGELVWDDFLGEMSFLVTLRCTRKRKKKGNYSDDVDSNSVEKVVAMWERRLSLKLLLAALNGKDCAVVMCRFCRLMGTTTAELLLNQ